MSVGGKKVTDGLITSIACLFMLCALGVLPAFAAESGAAATAQGSMTPFQFIFGSVQFFLIAFFIYFWLAIRPQHLREDERKKFVGELKKNDEVITSGGIFGKVVAVKDDSVTLEIANGVKVRVHTDHILPLPPQSEGMRLQAAIQKTAEQ